MSRAELELVHEENRTMALARHPLARRIVACIASALGCSVAAAAGDANVAGIVQAVWKVQHQNLPCRSCATVRDAPRVSTPLAPPPLTISALVAVSADEESLPVMRHPGWTRERT
jgi:hypothetical protein